MSAPTDKVLRWLANLSCALEDHQSFMEAGDENLAEVSKEHAAESIQGIRDGLAQIERSVGLA